MRKDNNEIPNFNLQDIMNMARQVQNTNVMPANQILSNEEIFNTLSSMLENNRKALKLATEYVKSLELGNIKKEDFLAIVFDTKTMILNLRATYFATVSDERLFEIYEEYMRKSLYLKTEKNAGTPESEG